MFNMENYGITTGRLTTDPQLYENADGSLKIRITVAAPNAYKNKDGSRSAQFLPLEDFIPSRMAKRGNGVYDMMHQGDKITVQYTVKNNNYEKTKEDGTKEMVYGLILQVENIRLMESKATTSARQAIKSGAEPEKPKDEPRRSTKGPGAKSAARKLAG